MHLVTNVCSLYKSTPPAALVSDMKLHRVSISLHLHTRERKIVGRYPVADCKENCYNGNFEPRKLMSILHRLTKYHTAHHLQHTEHHAAHHLRHLRHLQHLQQTEHTFRSLQYTEQRTAHRLHHLAHLQQTE